ncbi:response regulator [Agarivorans sp. Toyoura001]|uniref:response regulator n=1 Tax=unclassified Agarivorans TaxID=2636026 RepID=UPI0010CE0125|nr:response regulator [Agarivorans sp. Toyoura001]GDY24282.1 DNA-binding response regulator [Agarivorans sp. Toyoura001]
MIKQHILIIEDEQKIAQLLADYLENDGFQVSTLNEGNHAVSAIKASQPAFVILDLMLPGVDGLTICKQVREFSDVPIMLLTARVDEISRLLGLELGADDYVCKPFLPREVVARVHAILRRVNAPKERHSSVKYRNVELSPNAFKCRVNGLDLELTPVEFKLLQTLMEQPGRVYSREQLMQHCYSDNRIVSEQTINSHIKNLRKKMAEQNDNCDIIHSIYGLGYKVE